MNPYQYYSPAAENLPKEMIEDIIQFLNRKQKIVLKNRLRGIESNDEVELKAILHFLDFIGLHACYNMVGYRGTYHFPTYDDCEMWEDWIWQCRDKED